MAKKKQDVAPIVNEEVIEETPIEEIPEEIHEEIVEEEEQPQEKGVDIDAFIERKLKVINELPNKAQAKSLAERVLRHKESRGNK